MKLYAIVITFSALVGVNWAQIKTRQPPRIPTADYTVGSFGQQYDQHSVYGQQSFDQNVYNRYNGNFKPAEYYQGEPIPPSGSSAPVVLDATAQFINKTRAGIASGICYTEVPTSTLAKRGYLPVSNGTSPGMSKIQICCEGYARNPHVFARCDPICADDCPNGICTAPNTCVCIPGHVRNEANKCVTTCPIGCEHGSCSASGECECLPGYALEPQHKKYCIPHCDPPCQFGKCVAPNKCACEPGFRMMETGACVPQCDNCVHGTCTAPGLCSCKPGYSLEQGMCQPVCALGCEHGICVAPDTCSCPPGSTLDRSGTKCSSPCNCLNGFCLGVDKCQCNPGYVPDVTDPHVCQPHCPQGCPNGYCSAPNFCSCNPGFVKAGIKGRLSCMLSN